MQKKDFAVRLAKLRISKGYSARDLSISLGQSPGYINSIENEKNYPSMDNFFYICDFLGITYYDFFKTDNKFPLKIQELLKLCERLDDSELDILILIARKMSQNKK